MNGLRGTAAAAIFLFLLAGGALAADALEDVLSPDPQARARGKAALEADAEGSLLLRALKSPEGIAREAGANAIAAVPAHATPPVREALRILLRDAGADLSARAAAARALGALADDAASTELRAALADLPAEAAMALAALGDPGALPDLRKAAAAAGASAAPEIGYSMAALGDASGEDLLLARLTGTDPAASASALLLLRRLTKKDLGNSASLWQDAIRLRRISAALGHRDEDLSEKAVAEQRARGASAGPDLLALLQDEGVPSEARARAALVLGLLKYEEAGPALLEAAGIWADAVHRTQKDPYVRVYAMEALGRIAWAPAAPALARMLVNDEDLAAPQTFADGQGPFHEVQGANVRALLAMGAEGALGAAADMISRGRVGILPVALVSDYRVRVYYEILAVLREYGGPGAKDGFGFHPEAGDDDRAAAATRAAAWWKARPGDVTVPTRARWSDPLFTAAVAKEIRILGEFKFLEMDRSRRTLILLGSPAVPQLVSALAVDPAADPSGQTRIGVAQVLASIGRPEAVAPVRAALARAEIGPVRAQILLALAALGPPDGVPEAVRMLGAPSPDERAAAAAALALCPTDGSLSALRNALRDAAGDEPLRISLATALTGLRDAPSVAILLDALRGEDSVLRRKAWDGLDRWVEGLGPFDPATGKDAAAVRAQWESQKAAPRFRDRNAPKR